MFETAHNGQISLFFVTIQGPFIESFYNQLSIYLQTSCEEVQNCVI